MEATLLIADADASSRERLHDLFSLAGFTDPTWTAKN
jgi:hypothetical protein